MADPTFPLFPIFAFLGFVLSLIPLPWHLQAWNSGTCAFMLWSAVNCLVAGINSVIWHGNVSNVAPVWCDISTQLMIGAGIGTPASILCISRRLYKITAIQAVSVTRADKRRDIMIDIGIALGIPLVGLALHTIVHAHRFDIYEDVGCYPVTYNTLLSFFIYFSWPIVLGCISFVYSALTLRSFFIRRVQFTSLLNSTNSINMNRYIRLMLLSICDMSLTVPMAIYVMYISTTGIPLSPWISWDDTHYNWTRVKLVPAIFWRSTKENVVTVELTRWLAVFCALLFFALFGFASEAIKNYKKVFWAVAKRVGYKSKTAAPKIGLTSWNRDPVKKRRDSEATLPVYTVSHPPPKASCSSDVELDLYSPGPEKGSFSPSSYTPSTWAPSIDVEIGSTVHGEEMDISESPAKAGFGESDFKPLPPLPTRDSSPFTFSPYGPPLRHAASMPLPQTRTREGSITVMIEQTTRVDS